jgi:hypothetical protein
MRLSRVFNKKALEEEDIEEIVYNDKVKAKARRLRDSNDLCVVPDRFYAKFLSSTGGCMRIEFSHNGI